MHLLNKRLIGPDESRAFNIAIQFDKRDPGRLHGVNEHDYNHKNNEGEEYERDKELSSPPSFFFGL
jgi:hypothetical protein